ncbi:phosphate ABC transporter substrate-binding protein PstS [Pararhizobium mangrovi]|uniref:Phosphate-binding protein PstS n=2 Tax=Pararhizobium mangrovi TaxID=2590452 RepID=A0A506U2T5_9HYPH|nr:phosphate ABC transporter substrate-binding protein PstS [Pararhizobium mangrovi]
MAAVMAMSAAHAQSDAQSQDKLAKRITGAGASFPYPVYSKWAQTYQQKKGVQLNYQAIGSGGGIKQIEANTVDFGASDKPLKPAELKQAGLMQFPTVMGGIVPIMNVEGLEPGQLVLDGPTLAQIFMGKITKWNDDAIKKLNPDVDLPDADISVVHRSDGSGTTFNFTYYLADVSDDWKNNIGVDASVQWPAGTGGKGNQGVANYVGQIQNSIGYVEYAYALQNKLTYAKMKNKDGNVVAPSQETFQAAAKGADWQKADGFYLILANQTGAKSWPMTAATFILLHTDVQKPQEIKTVLDFFNWAYADGDQAAEKLDYVPFPDSVVKLIKTEWHDQLMADGKPIWPMNGNSQ